MKKIVWLGLLAALLAACTQQAPMDDESKARLLKQMQESDAYH